MHLAKGRETDQVILEPAAKHSPTCLMQKKFLKNENDLFFRMEEGKYEWSGLQERGDCSLRIRSADINYDDGENLNKTHSI